jgi:hypothetical protein
LYNRSHIRIPDAEPLTDCNGCLLRSSSLLLGTLQLKQAGLISNKTAFNLGTNLQTLQIGLIILLPCNCFLRVSLSSRNTTIK